MRRLLLALLLVLISSGAGVALPPTFSESADAPLTVGGWEVQQIRHFYATGDGDISESMSVQHQGTQLFELISVEIHLSDVGGANSLTMTQNSGLGDAYDSVWINQDMTSVTDLVVLYEPGEAMFSKLDTLDFAWTNASARTYGLTVKYRLR